MSFDTRYPAHREYMGARLELAGAIVALAEVSGDATLAEMAKRLAVGVGEFEDDAVHAKTMHERFPPVEQIEPRLAFAINTAVTRYGEAVLALRKWVVERG